MNFGNAIEALKNGKKVARKGWNGKGMYLVLVDSSNYTVNPEVHQDSLYLSGWIGMRTTDSKLVPWLPSQTDVLAEDWEIVDKGQDIDNDSTEFYKNRFNKVN